MTTEEKRCPFCRRLWDESVTNRCPSCGRDEQSDAIFERRIQRLMKLSPLLRFSLVTVLCSLWPGFVTWGVYYLVGVKGELFYVFPLAIMVGFLCAILYEIEVFRRRRQERSLLADLDEIFRELGQLRKKDYRLNGEKTSHE